MLQQLMSVFSRTIYLANLKTAAMAPMIYFGVELEFCLGYLMPGMPNPDPTSTRFVEFSISGDTISEALKTTLRAGGSGSGSAITRKGLLLPSPSDPSTQGEFIMEEVRGNIVLPAAREHIGQALVREGLPFAFESNRLGATQEWAIGTDTSINTKRTDSRYLWYAAEITSPAYQFNSASLRAVEKVCDILSSQYLTKWNDSCGLHVHVSFGVNPDRETEHQTWSFENLKKLMMFFWVFEPQFDTMHPPSRSGTDFIVRSMRIDSKLALDLQNEKVLPGSLVRQGLDRIYATKTLPELTSLVSRKRSERNMAVSMYHITQFLHPGTFPDVQRVKGKIKPTVEFRQHEGTLDSERVVKWVQTVIGVVKWLEERDVDPESLMDLELEVWESWKEERFRGESNVADEVEAGHGLGPGEEAVRDEGERYFRVVELFELIGLPGQADFYSTRLYDTLRIS